MFHSSDYLIPTSENRPHWQVLVLRVEVAIQVGFVDAGLDEAAEAFGDGRLVFFIGDAEPFVICWEDCEFETVFDHSISDDWEQVLIGHRV